MFNLLIFIGFALIILGKYMEMERNAPQEFNELRFRIENIENILFNNDPLLEDDAEDFKNIEIDKDESTFKRVMDQGSSNLYEDRIEISSNPLVLSEVISQYEDGKYTIEEVCTILNMKKGEVLLLKNLYKKYQI